MREDRDKSTTQAKQPLQLFVADVSNDANRRDLKHLFYQYGKVQCCGIIERPDGHKCSYDVERFHRSIGAQSSICRANGGGFVV